ncbi:MAG: hypothetical protein HBSAPP04_21000 [Ignavibacteriaceae bacterium]|nr:MAG: hypothetical protein EDM75_07970 [Chlorobiota bacterium]GJQ33261.1 MAG: hypothetical protein HBSAPP04_21000 [Ignavibacteriaceae bacterium]
MKVYDAVREVVESGELISREEIAEVVKEHQPGISQSNLNWTIREVLSKTGVKSISKGKYQKSEKYEFMPEYSPLTTEVGEFLISQFPGIVPVVWNTRILNYFSQHMLFNSFIVVEVEKEIIEPLFETLQVKFEDVFLEPSEEILWRYARKSEVIVVKKVVSQAPLLKFHEMKTVSLEKLIVDLHSKDAILSPFHGGETLSIVRSIFQKHIIRFDRLMRYAGRRGLKPEVYQTLSDIAINHSYKF